MASLDRMNSDWRYTALFRNLLCKIKLSDHEYLTHGYGNIPTRIPLTGAWNAGGLCKKIKIFDQYLSRCISEMVENRAIVNRNANK